MGPLPLGLIYSSRFAPGFPGSPEDQEEEIGKIIRASIRNNRERAITGLLLVHRGWFLQALEGPEAAVTETYARILADHRHCDAAILARSLGRRAFPNWNMCARRLSNADDAILAKLGGALFEPSTWTAAQALELLIHVRDRQAETMTALL